MLSKKVNKQQKVPTNKLAFSKVLADQNLLSKMYKESSILTQSKSVAGGL